MAFSSSFALSSLWWAQPNGASVLQPRSPSPPQEPILPERYATRLFRSSMTTGVSVYVAMQNDLWHCALFTLMVLLTSLNYWRHPVHGWRRNLDMACVAVGMSYHLYCASYCDVFYQLGYLMFFAKIVFCYRMARTTKDHNTSSAWHSVMHVVGNLGNLFLYKGLTT